MTFHCASRDSASVILDAAAMGSMNLRGLVLFLAYFMQNSKKYPGRRQQGDKRKHDLVGCHSAIFPEAIQ